MRRLVMLALLAGCAAPVPLARAPIPLRNFSAPVASQADVTMARLAGDWVVVQGAGLRPGTRITIGGGTMTIDGVRIALLHQGQGRLLLGDQALWVHWLDGDNRTAAIGDPEGRRVWIMDRTGAPGERLRAAREILEWYGYDLQRLDKS